jgi:lipoprotein-anchoring transpeptidase ErfK/SrfK
VQAAAPCHPPHLQWVDCIDQCHAAESRKQVREIDVVQVPAAENDGVLTVVFRFLSDGGRDHAAAGLEVGSPVRGATAAAVADRDLRGQQAVPPGGPWAGGYAPLEDLRDHVGGMLGPEWRWAQRIPRFSCLAGRGVICWVGGGLKSLQTIGVLAFAVAMTACQAFRPQPPPDVPVAMSQGDLQRIETALADSPRRLAVFHEELAASPLDPARSGIIVDLDRQRAYVYSQGSLVAASRIASGKRNFRTPTGDFRIGQKSPDHSSNLYGKLVDEATGEEQPGEVDTRVDEIPEGMVFRGAPMRHFMRFHTLDGKFTAIGLHQGHVPNYPASHGCIRLPWRSARELYKMIPSGTPVRVHGVKHGQPDRPLPELPPEDDD